MRSASVAMVAALALGGLALGLALLAARDGVPGLDVVGSVPDRPAPVHARDGRSEAPPPAATAAAPGSGSASAPRVPARAAAVQVDRVVRPGRAAAFVVLAVNGGPPAPHAVGDAIAPGVRVARIEPDAVWIERAGGPERIVLPRAEAAPEPSPQAARDEPAAPTVIATAAGRAHPARPALDRVIAAEAARQALAVREAEAAGR